MRQQTQEPTPGQEHKRIVDFMERTKTYHLVRKENKYTTLCGLAVGIFREIGNDHKKPLCKNCLKVYNYSKL